MGQVDRTWIGLNGEVFCTRHAGHYLTKAVAADPRMTNHQTPLNDWIDTATLDLPAHCGACETCP